VFWLASLAFIFVTGIFSGSYPAFYLSSFKPLKILKGNFHGGSYQAVPRKILVVLQFTVSVIMIIGTIIVYQQIQHAKDRPTGYNKNDLVNLSLQDEIKKHFDVMSTELKNLGAIEEMAACSSPLTAVWNTNGNIDWEGKDPNLVVEFPNNAVSHDFGRTVQWEIKEGRDFSREFSTDSLAMIINESAAKVLPFDAPIGKTLRWGPYNWTIIGVVKDVLQESPFFPVRPTVYRISSFNNMANLVLRLNPRKNTSESISIIEKIWKKYVPGVPFGYEFVDEQFGEKFRSEIRLAKLTSSFAVLAILISSLGLFGMASFVSEQRTKEIGIRKILGASVTDVWGMLSKEFVLMVILSCAIASPIAYYFLEKWLANYNYKITIGLAVFIVAGAAALIIALSTVSFHAIKAALANPIKSLRSE
jgi:ABC-type antimicrobial peptide transport system permease subunit